MYITHAQSRTPSNQSKENILLIKQIEIASMSYADKSNQNPEHEYTEITLICFWMWSID